MIKILVLEDELMLNQIICITLTNNGYQVKGCLHAEEAYDEIYSSNYDLVISDIMMPDIDGFEFAETIKEMNQTLPILFVTARDDFSAKKRGFQLGIDDYMTKPINMEELVLRVGAILRRAHISVEQKITMGTLIMDEGAMSATVAGEEIAITVREFNILYKLLSYPNHAFSRAQLMDEFWGIDSETSLRSVDVYITKLREKFSQVEAFKIVTVHGLGYKVVPK